MIEHPDKPRIAVIGGGITGMAAAYTLQEEARQRGIPMEIALFESAQNLGGKIRTERVDGFTIEGGPDSFISQKTRAANLCRQIGLEDEIIGTNDDRRKTFVVNRGRLTPLPDGVMLIIPTRFMPFALSPLISIPGKLRMGMDLFLPARRDGEDESLAHFIRRRLGSEALEKIAEPLMSGIHVSDSETQSILGTFPRFRAMEEKYGSLTLAMLAQQRAAAKRSPDYGKKTPLFQSLRGGLSQMVQTLESRLAGVEIHTGTPVAGISRSPSGGYELHLDGDRAWMADSIILTAPAYLSASLVAQISPHLAALFERIRYVSTATVSLAFRTRDLSRSPQGFGFVVPRTERKYVSACTHSSIKFDHRAPPDTILMRCFFGGPGHEDQVDWDDETLISAARKDLARLSGIESAPILARVFRWRRANPQYDVGHPRLVESIHAACGELPGVFTAGGALEGVGIPDCITQGEAAAGKSLAFITGFDRERNHQ